MNLFTKKVVGLDFHDYSAQVVEIRKDSKGISLEKYHRMVIPSHVIDNGEIVKAEELKEILVSLLKNANPGPIEEKDVAIVLPASKILTHIFTFPAALKEDEIAKALPYEVEKLLPFSVDDIFFDFKVLEKQNPKEKHASQFVFFACIKREIAEQYAQVIESMGATPYLMGIQSEALKSVVAKEILKTSNSLIIDIGTLSVNYLLLEKETTKKYVSVNEGGYKFLKELAKKYQISETEVLEKKEKKILSTMEHTEEMDEFMKSSYEKAKSIINGTKPDNIILTGEFLNFPNFYKMAKATFPDQNVIIGDPKLCLHIDPNKFLPFESNMEEAASPYSIYFVNAIGVALNNLTSGASDTINLIPERLKEKLSNKKMALLMTIISLFMTAVTLFFATFMMFKFQEVNYQRQNLEIQKSSIDRVLYGTRYQEIRDEILSFNNEVNALRTIDQKLYSVPTIIHEITEKIPVGIDISVMRMRDDDLSIEIHGVAQDREKILEFKENLKEIEIIKEVFAPISNFDEKLEVSFVVKLNLEFSKLPKYATETNTN